MVIRIAILAALILAFGAGYFFGLPEEDGKAALQKQIASLQQKNDLLTANNDELAQTLGLIRRQVQTDRVAYEKLKKDVESSEQQREQLREKFDSQRQLLDRLKKKIEEL